MYRSTAKVRGIGPETVIAGTEKKKLCAKIRPGIVKSLCVDMCPSA
jgi:hypothetical protein